MPAPDRADRQGIARDAGRRRGRVPRGPELHRGHRAGPVERGTCDRRRGEAVSARQAERRIDRFAYVRDYYNLPWLKRGVAVTACGKLGTVTDATHYIFV